MQKPLNTYVRVPFRGTHYVEAAALDSAIAQIADLEKKLGVHPDEQGGAIEVPDESALTSEADAAQEKALEDLIHLVGGSLLDGETGPVEILAYVNKCEEFAAAQQQTITDRDLKIIDLESALASEQGLHGTTKEMLAGAQRELAQLVAWLRGESPSPYTLHIKALADELRQKVINAFQGNAAAVETPEAQGTGPEGSAQA